MTGKVLYAFQYDAARLLSKITDAENRDTVVLRDAQAKTVTLVGPFGHATKIELGADGYAKSITGPDSHAVKLGYKSAGSGLLESLTDPKDNATTFTYDANGRLISDKDPGGGSKVLASDKDIQVQQSVSVTTALGRTSTYDVDESDPALTVREVTGTDGLSARTERVRLKAAAAGSPAPLDAEGHVVQVNAPGVAPVVIEYVSSGPNRGRPWRVSQSTGGVTRATEALYDPVTGDVTDVTSPLDETTHYDHDANGRGTHVLAPDGRTFDLQRDANGNVTDVTPAGPGGNHHFGFNSRNLVSAYTLADVGAGDESTTSLYSLDGEPGLSTLPDGSTIIPSFDAMGRLKDIVMSSGTTTFDYYPLDDSDPSAGKLSSVTSPDGIVQAFTYAGALTTDVTWTGPVTGALHYTYDDQFRAESETVGSSPAIVRSWNPDGQVDHVEALAFTYDPATGLLQGTTLASIADTVTWNAFGDLDTYSAKAGAAPLLSRAFPVRDALGRIVQATETRLGGSPAELTYSHDKAGRLTDVWQGAIALEHYDYDPHGNRTGTTYAGQPATSATFDAQDRIVTFGDATYTHKITGERESKASAAGLTTYSYDTTSQLKSVTLLWPRQRHETKRLAFWPISDQKETSLTES